MSKLSFWKNKGLLRQRWNSVRLHEATCAQCQFWACFRWFGDDEKAKERRSFGERILLWGEGGAPLDVYVVEFMWFMGDMRGEMGLKKG